MARINIVRVPKNVVWIACLHVLHSAVSTIAIKFWYGKIKFWDEFWAQFFGQHTKKPPHGTHAALFIQTWRRKSIRWVPPHKKRTSGTGIWSIWSTEVNKPVSLVRFGNKSILSLFSNFNWTFLYASSFLFGVYALSKLRSIVSYFMTLRRSSLVSILFQDTPRDF